MNISKIIEIKQNEWEIFSTILRIKFQSKGQLLINNETSLNSRRTHKANISTNAATRAAQCTVNTRTCDADDVFICM